MIKKVLCGLTIMLIGFLVLLSNFNVIEFSISLSKIWPIVLLMFVLGNIIDNKKLDVGSLILFVIGVYYLLRNYGVLNISFMQLVFPIILILIGIAIMLPKKEDKEINVEVMRTIKNDIMLNSLFSGSESRVESKSLRKIEMTAVFGATTLDLRKAATKDGKCVCYATCIFGGSDIILSDDWNVNMDGVTTIFGGIENKRIGNEDAKNTLYIKGLVAFGGIDIK